MYDIQAICGTISNAHPRSTDRQPKPLFRAPKAAVQRHLHQLGSTPGLTAPLASLILDSTIDLGQSPTIVRSTGSLPIGGHFRLIRHRQSSSSYLGPSHHNLSQSKGAIIQQPSRKLTGKDPPLRQSAHHLPQSLSSPIFQLILIPVTPALWPVPPHFYFPFPHRSHFTLSQAHLSVLPRLQLILNADNFTVCDLWRPLFHHKSSNSCLAKTRC